MVSRILALMAAPLLLLLMGCGATTTSVPNGSPSAPAAANTCAPTTSLLVAAASDLQAALPGIVALYKQQACQEVVLTFGSTGTLSQQIENGGPYDVFMAADASYVDGLKNKGLVIADTVQLYGQGRIVLAINKQSGLATSVGAQLISPLQGTGLAAVLTNSAVKQIAIANPDHAPYGRAAMQALQAAGIWEQVKPKLVLGENITQALQYVQTGNAQIGIVALSISNVPEISSTLIDAKLHEPLNQMAAVLTRSTAPDAGRVFIAFLNGAQGRTIMKKYGFARPGE
jgi:molybdate transport system substrate-binding protein